MAKTTAAASTRPSRRIWRGPAKPSPVPPKGRLMDWYMQTMRNMQALGYGHQRGLPCVVFPDGSAIALDLDNDAILKRLSDLVEVHGAEGIQGVGYVYWNETPEGLLAAHQEA